MNGAPPVVPRQSQLASWVLRVVGLGFVGAVAGVFRPSPGELGAAFGGTFFAYLLAERGRARWSSSKFRSLTWALWSLVGLAFVWLFVACQRLPPSTRNTPYVLQHQLVRFASLGTGVVFLMALLAAALPFALDLLERRSFVSFVSARHIRATKSGFLTVISVLSMAGVGVSSCALSSVTSIMGGFGADLKRKILRNSGHVVVDSTRLGGFGEWNEKLDAVRGAVRPFGGAVTPVAQGEAMGSSASNTAGMIVRGIDLATIGEVIDLKDNIEVGSFDYLEHPELLDSLPATEIIGRGPGGEPYLRGPSLGPGFDRWLKPEVADALRKPPPTPGLIVGKELAKSLHILVGDELTLISPLGDLGPMGIMPRTKKFRVAGIFYSGMYEYDAAVAFATIDVAQKFFDLDGKITHLDVRVPDPEQVGAIRPSVEAAVAPLAPSTTPGGALRVRDWIEMNKNLFSALKLEKVMTFIILGIAIAVASFCIVCTLLLMVTEKGKEIAILKALGASDSAVQRIFVAEGIIIGAIGTTFGVGFALAACSGLKWAGVRLDPEVYYVDRLPVNVNLTDYALVAAASLLICTLSTIYPARTASKLMPVDGIRWE